MALVIKSLNVPVRLDDHGTARVGQSRVTLETVIGAFQDGEAAETIVRQYDTLTLADVYSVIAYYLQHRDDVDAYLREEEKEATEVRRQWEARCPPDGIKEQLLARRAAKEAARAALPRR